MAKQRNYWVVSPNVKDDEKTVEAWKQKILDEEAAIIGWGPDDYRPKNWMGPRFAGKETPSVQQRDVILIARSRKNKDVVAVGVVDGGYQSRTYPELSVEPVYLRHLKRFTELLEVPGDVPLGKLLPSHGRALIRIPDGYNAIVQWLKRELQLGDRVARTARRSIGAPRQPDIDHRHAVEKAAQDAVEQYYRSQNYHVVDVSSNNYGWDLEPTRHRCTLHVEVKGLSGATLLTELTPNEYSPVESKKRSYRLCIVTHALNNSMRHIYEFSFNSKQKRWEDQEGNQLIIEERKGARVRV